MAPFFAGVDTRDHRPDCEQLVLALIVNQEGFPFSYEVFDGNRADVSTVEAILRTVERKHGKARRVWIFDRGVVSEENLVAIRKRGGEYLVGTPRSKLKQFEAELLKDDFEKIRPDVEVKQVQIPGGEETYILCRTAGRKEKEKAIRSRFVAQIEKALTGLEKRIAEGKLKDRDKMLMRLGRIQASHPQVADLYEMAIKDNQGRTRLVWRQKSDQQEWLEAREGVVRTRRPAWQAYRQCLRGIVRWTRIGGPNLRSGWPSIRTVNLENMLCDAQTGRRNLHGSPPGLRRSLSLAA